MADHDPNYTSRVLPVRLSPEEVKARAEELVRSLSKVQELEEDRKSTNDRFKQKIKNEKLKVGALAQSVRSHIEDREVDCEWNPNHERRQSELYRLDTGELIEHRPMTIEERNLELPLRAVPGGKKS